MIEGTPARSRTGCRLGKLGKAGQLQATVGNCWQLLGTLGEARGLELGYDDRNSPSAASADHLLSGVRESTSVCQGDRVQMWKVNGDQNSLIRRQEAVKLPALPTPALSGLRELDPGSLRPFGRNTSIWHSNAEQPLIMP